MMRVLIDALPLLVRSAGVKNYLYYWIQHLRQQAGADAIRLFPDLGNLPPLDHEKPLAGRIRTVTGLGSLAAMNYLRLPMVSLLGARADIFHSTNLIHHPPRRRVLTTTVHDVTSWIMPEFHSRANQRADRSFEATLRRADRILAVSEHTRQDVIRVLGIDERKIEAIHSGVPQRYFRVTEAEAATARDVYRLTRPFVLFLGTIEPRKNIGTLLDAWEPVRLKREFDLVLAGPSGWASPELKARLAAPPTGVRYLGYVAEEHLAGLTAAASVFVYPSLYEGFGFPVAQAMAAGTPVVTSNVSSLPEIAGEAAILVDPRSPAELTNALNHLLESPGARAERSDLGRLQAQQFTWERCAAHSLNFFRRALS